MSTLDDEIAAARRRLEELEAQKRALAIATPSATPGAEREQPSPLRVLVLSLGAVAIFVIVISLFAGRSGRSVEVASDNVVDPLKVEKLDLGQAEAGDISKSAWTYDVSADAMTDAQTSTACVISRNKVHLSAPYDSVSAQLCVRRHPRHGLDVILSLLGEGQFMCRSYEPCRVRMRYDEAPMVAASAQGPSDHSSNIVFILGAAKVVERLKGTQVTRIQAEYYNAGEQVLEFETAGLEWPVKDGVADAASGGK